MAPKRNIAPVAEREVRRAKVLALFDAQKTQAEIVQLTNIPKQTVSVIIRDYGPLEKRASLRDKPRSGRPPKLAERFVAALQVILALFVTTRHSREILKVAHQNPKWGAEKVKDYWRTNLITALSNRPPGAVIQVRNAPHSPTRHFPCPTDAPQSLCGDHPKTV